MSDLPAEIAGALPFLDYTAGQTGRLRVLVAGLGLGIVPAWLLAHASIARIDIIEIDADAIGLIIRGCLEQGAPNQWPADPRLHIHRGDAHTCWPGPARRHGCAVHGDCVLQADCTWHAAFFDIWDGISPVQLAVDVPAHPAVRPARRRDVLVGARRMRGDARLRPDSPAAVLFPLRGRVPGRRGLRRQRGTCAARRYAG